MNIYCSNCNQSIPVSDVDLKEKIAKCTNCNNIFNCSNQLKNVIQSKREEIKLPRNIVCNKLGFDLEIIIKWFGFQFIFLTFFCAFWDGFLIVWYSIAILQKQYIMAIFATVHALIGIGMTYYTIAGYINKTYINVNANIISIKDHPLPFFRNKNVSSNDVRQVYSKEKITYSRNSVNYTYEVHAKTNANTDVVLVTGLSNCEQALYIEQEIEKFLCITDELVRGELPK